MRPAFRREPHGRHSPVNRAALVRAATATPARSLMATIRVQATLGRRTQTLPFLRGAAAPVLAAARTIRRVPAHPPRVREWRCARSPAAQPSGGLHGTPARERHACLSNLHTAGL